MKGITKRLSGAVANNQIDFNQKAGEIHALLGKNSPGKTATMNILYGFCQIDARTGFLALDAKV